MMVPHNSKRFLFIIKLVALCLMVQPLCVLGAVVEESPQGWATVTVSEDGTVSINGSFTVSQGDCAHENTRVYRYGHEDSDCENPGGYHRLTYCEDCGGIISNIWAPEPPTGHQHVSERFENENAGSCTEPHSYDRVEYCKDCGKELSREHISEDIPGHKGGTATCISPSMCSVCGKPYGEKDPNNHSGTKLTGAIPSTDNAEGYTGDVICPDCKAVIIKGVPIPVAPKNTEIQVVLGRDASEGDVSANIIVSRLGETKGAYFDISLLNNVEKKLSLLDVRSEYVSVAATRKQVRFRVTARTSSIVKGKRLYLYGIDPESGGYVAIKGAKYKVGKNGVTIPGKYKFAEYYLADDRDAKAINDQILSGLYFDDQVIKLSVGDGVILDLDKGAGQRSISKIKYSSSDSKKVKAGKGAAPTNVIITRKKPGRCTVSAVVTLKNGFKKRISIIVDDDQ